MNKVHDFIFDQGIVGFISCLVAGVLFALGAIIYPATAANVFNPDISVSLVVLFAVSAVLSFANVFLRLKEGRLIAFVLSLLCLIYYIGTQTNYVANIIIGIDGTLPSFSLIMMADIVFFGLVASLLSFILLREKPSLTKVYVNERSENDA